MFNVEVFRDLCRKATAEKDPAKLEQLKDELHFMLQAQAIELRGIDSEPVLKRHQEAGSPSRPKIRLVR
jgi:hypothetical protein